MPNQSEEPKAPMPHSAWLGSPDARLPPPSLPRARHNLGCPGRADDSALYCGGGGLSGTVNDMAALSHLLARNAAYDSSIPSGFTYLAQLVAHDLASPTEGVFQHKLGPLTWENFQNRSRKRAKDNGLSLNSLFGELPQRAKLPGLHRFATTKGAPVAVDLLRKAGADGKFQPQIADIRNDDTPMLAQLSALFVYYFHTVLGRIGVGTPARLMARYLTVEMYHRVISTDLLPRICHSDVIRNFDVVAADDPALWPTKSLPIEVMNAAFRFGHCMVRSEYRLNPQHLAPFSIKDLMAGIPDIETLRGQPGQANLWRVDWDLFFGDGPMVQHAKQLGPGLSAAFCAHWALPGQHQIPQELGQVPYDLIVKDLARSVDGGLQKVSALADQMRPDFWPRFADWLLWSADGRQKIMQDWATSKSTKLPDHVVQDPPLFLFVLIEAGAKGQGFGGGQTLGALGSWILLKTLRQRMNRAKAVMAQHADTLEAARKQVGTKACGISQMTDLIRFVPDQPA